MKTFLYPLIGHLLLSCADGGPLLTEATTREGTSFLALPLKEGRLMTDAEFTLAFNICQAYRTKSVNFKGEHINKTFYFVLKEKTCRGEISRYSLGVRFNGDEFLSSSSQSYIRGFETHEQGHLALPCRYILQGEKLRNPALFPLSERQSMEVTFISGDSWEHYLVRMEKGELFRFQINLDHSSPMVGTNMRTTLWQVCDESGPVGYSELVQKLQSPDQS